MNLRTRLVLALDVALIVAMLLVVFTPAEDGLRHRWEMRQFKSECLSIPGARWGISLPSGRESCWTPSGG